MCRRTIQLCLSVFFVSALAAGYAQGGDASTQPLSSVSCPPTATLDDLTKALDEAISGAGNKDRTCLRNIMLPEARLSPVGHSPQGEFTPRLLGVEDWINAVAKRGSKPFFERQIKVITETYGHFAHLWSTYEIHETPDGPATVTGINSIQAVHDGKRWRVLNVLWEPDSTAGPVPEKYKP